MNIKDKIKQFSTAKYICNLLIAAKAEVRFIGGCVRDAILNKKFSDIDIATNLLPEKVESILKINNIDYFSIGKDFGTITAIVDNHKFEITTLRKDLNCDGRYAKVQFTDNWQEDAERRDFTINALSCDLEGNIYDYFNGINDLENGIVQFIGNPEQRIIEDHLRILRFFRFSAYYALNIDSRALLAIKKHVKHLTIVSGTRIRAELSKILLAPNALNILKVMEECDLFNHIILCDASAIKSLERLYTNANDYCFDVNEILCLSILLKNSRNRNEVINSFGFTRAQYNLLEILMNTKITDWSESAIKDIFISYKEHFKEIIIVNLSLNDVSVEIKESLKKLFQISIMESPISSEDIKKLGVEPGKKMGYLLKFAEKIWFNHEFKISKAEILKELSKHVNEL